MSARQRRLRVTTVLVLFGFVVGCDSEFSPVIEQDLAVTAQFVEFSPNSSTRDSFRSWMVSPETWSGERPMIPNVPTPTSF